MSNSPDLRQRFSRRQSVRYSLKYSHTKSPRFSVQLFISLLSLLDLCLILLLLFYYYYYYEQFITCSKSQPILANLRHGNSQMLQSCRKQSILSLFRKDDNDGDLTMLSGSLFQISGAADRKARVPMTVLFTGTTSRKELSVASIFRSARLIV